ncbi:MAG: RsbRD N-terminal domain-containing protein [Thermodesulfovibrionales bacterium]|nr:RsbRD N-terminal domain-containing protein [Thermodesulfovibrionales bacterium]
MLLKDFLLERKSSLSAKWFERVVETYPSETAKFLKNQKDPFGNPVGSTILQGIDNLFNQIIEDEPDTEKILPLLDSIIRIRAIQDFSASEAVAFIFYIKDIIRQEFERTYTNSNYPAGLREEFSRFEAKVDRLALLSFDIYMRCREKIYELKAQEVKNMTYRLLQQAKLIVESPERSD